MLVGLEAETLLEKARKKINERVDKRLKRINNLISTQV
jgi:flagellar hook-associated protein FlgK